MKLNALQFAFAVLLPILTLGSVSRDARAATCDAISCSGTIKALTVMKEGHSMGGLVRLDTDSAPGNCDLSEGTSWLITPTSDNVIKTLTAAHLAGRKVKLRATSGVTTCTIDYVTLW